MNQAVMGEPVNDGSTDDGSTDDGSRDDGSTDGSTEGSPVDGATLRRQAHRVLMASFYGTEIPDWLATGLDAGIGSICLFGSNLTGDDEQVRQLAAALHRASPDGTLITLDEEGGDVTRLDAGRGSPTAGHAVLGAADDPLLTRQVAAGLGRRLRDLGIDLDLGPVADVNCEPDNPVIGVRSFGADPALVARHVEAFVGGLQEAGTAACVKHFPGHGATVEDSHLAVPRLDLDLATLRARELVPFAAAVRAGTAAVMTSHIVITALDAGRPATTSPPVLELLRTELGFEGVLVTDALDMVGASRPYGGIPNAAVAALAAGADLLCLGPDHYVGEQEQLLPEVVSSIVTAVREGRLAPDRLAQAADRVEQLIDRTVDQPGATVNRSGPPSDCADDEPLNDPNIEAARRALVRRPADGPLPTLAGAVVVEFDVTPGIAAGPVPWGLAEPLARLLPGIERRRADADDPTSVTEHLRAAAPDRPLVAVVRDAHRHSWVAGQLAELAAARPDLVTVETGWPVVDENGKPTGLPGAVKVWAYGGSSVSLNAVARALAPSTAQHSPHHPGTTASTDFGGTTR
jgi:beta-N-acetylhexosaminidase